MKRTSENLLTDWYNRPKRKPLIIRGARQVGKSTLVRQFSKNTQLTLCEVNLERHLYLEPLFKTLALPKIVAELEAICGRSLFQPNTILFLDEIQATPSVLPLLRYLYEDYPNLPIICAGSLLEFALKDHPFSMPVGRIEYYHLGPMCFTEFLLALDETYALDALQNFEIGKEWPLSLHQKLLQLQREFLLIGGMPEAVFTFTKNRSLQAVQPIQESILATYSDDFSKYTQSKTELIRLQKLFRYVPAHVGNKIKYSHFSQEERSREIKHSLWLLTLAKVITPVTVTPASGVPLEADENLDLFKSLFLDIGLLNRICGLDWTAIQTLSDRNLVNEGRLAEQFIGQHLLYRNKGLTEPRLHYWIREKQQNAEIDYVISQGSWILPIEVKAGASGSLKSLLYFSFLKKPPLCIRFDLNPPSLSTFTHTIRTAEGNKVVSYRLLSLPLYMVDELTRLIDTQRHFV